MPPKTIEIARSFSQKVSNPQNKYENCDFFCSIKVEVSLKEQEEVSELLFDLCRKEVEKSIKKYLEPDFSKTDKDWDEKKQQIYNENSQLAELVNEQLPIIEE